MLTYLAYNKGVKSLKWNYIYTVLQSKQTLSLLAFLFASILIVIFSINMESAKYHKVNTQIKNVEKKLEIQGVSFYYTFKNRPYMKLNAEGLININDSFSIFKVPVGEIKDEEGKSINFMADEANYDGDEDMINFNGKVNIHNDEFQLDARNISINLETSKYEASGSIKSVMNDPETKDKIFVMSQYFEGYPNKRFMEFTGQVEGELKRHRIYESGFKFQTDSMNADFEKSRLYMDKNVRFQIDSLEAKAGRAEILLRNHNKSLKYYSLYDDIDLEQKVVLKNKTIKRTAKAEKMVGMLSLGKIILTGAPQVYQDEDIIKGYEIILRKNLEMIEVEQSKSKFSIKK